MLKMYLPHADSGATADFWEAAWTRQAMADSVACFDPDPLRDHLARLLPHGGITLDGGRGIGAWTTYHSRRGQRRASS